MNKVMSIGNYLSNGTHKRARTIIRPTGGIIRGKFPSVKNCRMVHYEGLLELDAIYLFETSPQVLSYREQPITIYFQHGEKLRRYTTDFDLELTDGRHILIEVKPKDALRREELRTKFELINDHMHNNGLEFAILTDDKIREEPRLSNLRWIYSNANKDALRKGFLADCLENLYSHFPSTIDVASKRLIGHQLDPFTLLLSGHLRCSMTEPLTYETLVHITTEVDHEWFYVSKEFGF